MNDYLLDVAASLVAAGFRVNNTAAVAHGHDQVLDIDGGTGTLELIWNERYGWIFLWLAQGPGSNGRPWPHNLTPDADPGAVVDEVKRALAEQTGGR